MCVAGVGGVSLNDLGEACRLDLLDEPGVFPLHHLQILLQALHVERIHTTLS